jgi:hypothetical protein
MFREVSWGILSRSSRRDERSLVLSGIALLLAGVLGTLAWMSKRPPSGPGKSTVPDGSTEPPKDATAAKDKCPDDPCVRVPRSVLVVALLWLVLLVASFICYEEIDGFADFVGFRLGRLPFETIWFGAVGGWLISAQGIFDHNREWHRSYDYWHYVRPILGAIIGTLGCLLFIVLNEAATKETPKPNAVFYDVIALAVGYREESFRKLIEKVFDSIILPGKKEDDNKAAGAPDGQPEAKPAGAQPSPSQ